MCHINKNGWLFGSRGFNEVSSGTGFGVSIVGYDEG